MRVLVLGSTGMLGHVVCATLLAQGHQVMGTLRPPAAGLPVAQRLVELGLVPIWLDLSIDKSVPQAFSLAKPDTVVNCAGIIKHKVVSSDTAMLVRLNSLLPHLVADEARHWGVRMIHISTDCVYSGRQGAYVESDPPDPSDAYGHSKCLGEVGSPNLTLRTSIVGWQASGKEGLVEWFWSQRGRRAYGYTNAVFSGLTAACLARIIAGLIVAHPRLKGLYHVSASRISKFDLLNGLNNRLGKPVDLIADHSVVIDRSLNGECFRTQTGISSPDWDTMLDELCDMRGEYHAT